MIPTTLTPDPRSRRTRYKAVLRGPRFKPQRYVVRLPRAK